MVKMGTVWDRTVEFLSDNLGLIVPIAIFAILVPTTISSSVEPLYKTAGLGLQVVFAVAWLGLSILTMWGQLTISALAIDPAIGARAKQVAIARLLPAIGVYVVLFALLMLLVVPIGVILALSGVDLTQFRAASNQMTLPDGVALPIALYGFVLLFVMIFVGARLAVVTPVVIAERRGLGAIPRAFTLTRGLTWKLIGVILLFAVVMTVATSAAQSVVGLIFALATGPGEGVTVGSVITAVIVAAISTGFTVLATAFVAKLYVAIIRAREAAEPAPLASDLI